MDIALHEVPESRRYWVVRADGGLYLEHFVQDGIVTIGHLDELDRRFPVSSSTPEKEWVSLHESLIRSRERDGRPMRGLRSVVGQARAFVADIKVGDWVVTPGEGLLKVGVVTSDAFEDPLEVVLTRRDGETVTLSHRLRRRVRWGPTVYKSEFTSPLQRTLSANQTVFNVDSHWEAICHALYPAFCRNDTLFLSTKISAASHVNNADVASYLLTLTDIELIVRALDDGLSNSNFDEKLEQYADAGSLTLTTKAEFFSPGDIWVQFTDLVSSAATGHSWMYYAVIAYGMIFGNKKLGFDGLVDLDTRHRIRDLMLERIARRRTESAANRLGADVPKKDTSALEQPNKKV
jgi:hypothetical protein